MARTTRFGAPGGVSDAGHGRSMMLNQAPLPRPATGSVVVSVTPATPGTDSRAAAAASKKAYARRYAIRSGGDQRGERQEPIGSEARRNVGEMREAAQEQAGADQQDQRERDL